MRQLFLVIILFPPGLVRAQTERPTNVSHPASFSTCAVTLTGSRLYAATITRGVAQDVNGNKWALPPLVTVPRGGKITVTATSTTPGAITALPGQIKIILTPTAGWIAVTNNSPAIPGQSLSARCEQALRKTTDNLFAFEEGGGCVDDCFQRLIPVYSGGKIDAYVSQHSLDEAVALNISANFGARLYFVYRDEGARQQAIASIQRNDPSALRVCSGVKSPKSCADELTELKYVMMDVDYYKTGLNVVTPDGKPVPGPVLGVNRSLYVVPTGCDAGDYVLSDYRGYPGAENETIWASHNWIGEESYSFVNGSNSPRWSLLLGDLAPLKTKIGFSAIRINREQAPLLDQVLLNVSQTIAEGIARSRATHP